MAHEDSRMHGATTYSRAEAQVTQEASCLLALHLHGEWQRQCVRSEAQKNLHGEACKAGQVLCPDLMRSDGSEHAPEALQVVGHERGVGRSQVGTGFLEQLSHLRAARHHLI